MSENRSICLLNDSFPPLIDGVANAVTNYAGRISSAHGRAFVVTPAYPDTDDSAFPFPVLRYPSIDTTRLVGYRAGYPFSPEVERHLRREGIDLLHTHCPVASTLLARELRDVLDAPIVFTYHTKFDIDIAKAIRGRLLQEGAVRALVQNVNACDEVWVVSRGAGENLRSLGYRGEYIVMPNGVDVPRGRLDDAAVTAALAGYDLPGDVPVFLFVGRLMWYKGIRLILDALAALHAEGRTFRMVFVGSGADEEEILDYVNQSGLSGSCLFTGAIRDREIIRAWYCRADLFLFPSTFDTNGLVVHEAAACSLSSVLIAGSCAAEDVTDGVNGFLIEETADAMAACLRKLCDAPETMRRVGERACADLYLSWDDAVDRAAARYEVVIDRYRSGYYDKRRTPLEEFLHTQGELMDVISRIMDHGEALERRVREEREELRERRQELHENVRAELHDVKESILDKLDRYL